MTTIAISGPRAGRLYGYERQSYSALEDKLFECLKEICDDTDSTVIVSSEQGAGQTGFNAACRARFAHPAIKVHVYRAFDGEENAWSEDGDFGKKNYRRMCKSADHTVNCSKETPDALSRSSAKHARAQMMADAADGVIVVSDFTHPDQLSGVPGEVAYLMRATLSAGAALWAIHPETLEVSRIDTFPSSEDTAKTAQFYHRWEDEFNGYIDDASASRIKNAQNR